MEPLLLSVEDAAHVIGIGRRKVYELIRDNEIKVVRIGRRTLVRAEELRTYVDRLAGVTA